MEPAYHIDKLASILGAEVLRSNASNIQLQHFQLLTDSRQLEIPERTLFFAITTASNDGHKFIPELFQKGVRFFVTNRNYKPTFVCDKCVFFKVPDVVAALQSLASHHLRSFSLPIIGITGSNGKTIVKEWLYQLLLDDFHIVRSIKSYNSQIGVPISVWQTQANHTLALFEAGISQKGEMDALEKILKPTIGVFTFAGDAHADGFSSAAEKLQEKLKLFTSAKSLIYCSDEPLLYNEIQNFAALHPALSTISWGFSPNSDVHVLSINQLSDHSTIQYNFKGIQYNLDIPFVDKASIHNVMTCATVCFYLGMHPSTFQQRVNRLAPVAMRLELLQAINNCYIINDSYSADLESLNIALHFLKRQIQYQNHVLILSDLQHTGLTPEVLYPKLADMINRSGIKLFIGVGNHLHHLQSYLQKGIVQYYFSSTNEAAKALPNMGIHHAVILLKGQRNFQFEKLSQLLLLRKHQTVLEINLTALRHNIRAYRSKLLPGVKMMGMVKAFGYGSGSYEVALALQQSGIDYFAVAYADEGVALRKAGISLPVMVMNIEESAFPLLTAYHLEPEIYSFSILKSFIQFLQSENRIDFPVHIKFNTGMQRLGFDKSEADLLINTLKHAPQVKVVSVFTHLASSDDASSDIFTLQQIHVIQELSNIFKQQLSENIFVHAANSAAVSRLPQAQLNMVRLGIGMYGIDPNPQMQAMLRPVIQFKTTVAQLRNIDANDTVGYNRKGKVDQPSQIATVRVGYADGFNRRLSNGVGYMLINGQKAPVIGNVCMDMTMLNVTGLQVQENDEVEIFGEHLPVQTLAKLLGTIPYEIFTSISHRVQRIYFEE